MTANQARSSCQTVPNVRPCARYSPRSWIHSQAKYQSEARVMEEKAANPRMRSPRTNAPAPAATRFLRRVAPFSSPVVAVG